MQEFTTEEVRTEFLNDLSPNALAALPYLFEAWALPHQRIPKGHWSTWVLLGGRGAGKTRAGAEWVRSQVEGSTRFAKGKRQRVALVGETVDQVREVMIYGESGILACSPKDRRPKYEVTRKRLVWPNGAIASIVSAAEPEALRGPQFDCAWLDELAKWRQAQEVWDMLQFCLRLGDNPQQMVTTTPRNIPLLRQILADDSTVQTHAPTAANRANLAPQYLQKVMRDYAGTRLGRQEIDGELLEASEDAFWSYKILDAERVAAAPELDRIVVAIDPPASSGKSADDCGIVVAGAQTNGPPEAWRAYVLADLTIPSARPSVWAEAVSNAFRIFKAARVVAEVNQGGEMVEAVLRQHAPLIPFRAVHASKGKVARAEPVAALYEQGRVAHVGAFPELEDQMCQFSTVGFKGGKSPDRVDALVWALTDLMIEPAAKYSEPRMRIISR